MNTMANPMGLIPQDDRSPYEHIESDAEQLTERLEAHVKKYLAPESEKQLRGFNSQEVCELLKISPSNLRKMHFDGKLPDGETDASRRKVYTAQQILEYRHILAQNPRTRVHYLPGRSQDTEKLQVISCLTFKGGSGKTTSATHLSQRFALKGYRVLVIDMDPQASLSTMMGLRPGLDFTNEGTIYDALRYDDKRVPLKDVIRKTYFPGIDLAPGGLILSEFETETPRAMMEGHRNFYLRLKAAIDTVEQDYDLVFIDCPPQLGFLTMTAMLAATSLLITVIPNMIDVASLGQFLTMSSSVLKVVEEAGHGFDYNFLRYLLCRYEPSDGPQTQMAGFLRSVFMDRVMTNPFLKSTAVADAGMTSETVYEIDRGQVNRATLNRALESINAVADELEVEIHKAWGRQVA